MVHFPARHVWWHRRVSVDHIQQIYGYGMICWCVCVCFFCLWKCGWGHGVFCVDQGGSNKSKHVHDHQQRLLGHGGNNVGNPLYNRAGFQASVLHWNRWLGCISIYSVSTGSHHQAHAAKVRGSLVMSRIPFHTYMMYNDYPISHWISLDLYQYVTVCDIHQKDTVESCHSNSLPLCWLPIFVWGGGKKHRPTAESSCSESYWM